MMRLILAITLVVTSSIALANVQNKGKVGETQNNNITNIDRMAQELKAVINEDNSKNQVEAKAIIDSDKRVKGKKVSR